MAWAPKYGLKGIIDASIRVKIESRANETNEKFMPLEFKTGKGTSGQASLFAMRNHIEAELIEFSLCCTMIDFFVYTLKVLQTAMEHGAQVMLYTLLMSERFVLCTILLSKYL